MNVVRILMLGSLAAGLAIAPDADAQTSAPTGMVTPSPRAADRIDNAIVPVAQLEAGSNSFTEGQARSRLEANGFSGISNLRKDDNGFWRASAIHGSNAGDVAMDFQGRIAHGAGVAMLGARPAVTGATTLAPTTMVPTGVAPTNTAPVGTNRALDGMPGNQPAMPTGRAFDRAPEANAPVTIPAPAR